jgi:hypothetical protein
MRTTEDLLRAALHARADRTTYEPTRIEDVATRARFEQRRQVRGRALAAAAAIAAVAIPVGVVLGTGPDGSPEPAGPVEPVTARIDTVSDLEQGAPPAIDHVDDTTYVFASGERVELPVDDGAVLDAAPYGGGVLVASAELGTGTRAPGLTWVDRDGTVRWTRCGSGELVTSREGTVTAYAYIDGGDCSRWIGPVLAWGPATGVGVDKDIVTANGQRIEPVGVTDDHALYNVLDARTNMEEAVALSTDLGPPQQVPGLLRAFAYDAATGLVAGCPADGRCLVVDAEEGSPRLTLDDNEVPRAFSPDGRRIVTEVLGSDAPTNLTVRDVATGEVLLRMTGTPSMVPLSSALAWEDDEHLLFSRVDSSGEALVRLGVDGSLELATTVEEPTLGGYLLPGS